MALTTNDLNQDTIPDVAIASDADINLESNLALVTSGEETFSAQDPIFANSGDLKGITTADLNEDTAPDVILTNPSNNQLVIFLSQP